VMLKVEAWANGLAESRAFRRLPPNVPDRVLSCLTNSYEGLVTQLGTALAGRIIVNASPNITASVEEVDAALKSLQARIVVFDPKYEGRNNFQVFNAVDDELSTWPLGIPLNLRKHRFLKELINTGMEEIEAHTPWGHALLFDPTPRIAPAPPSISPDETAVGYWAAGKTVLFSHRAVVNSGGLFGHAIGLSTTDRICLAAPAYTPQGLQTVLASVAHAAVVVIPSLRFVAEEALVTIEKNVCNVLHASPQQLKAILDSPSVAKHDLSSLQKIVLVCSREDSGTSAELSQIVERAMSSLKVKDVMVGYTADNVAGVFLTGSARENPTNPTAGRLLPHLEAKIVGGGKAGNLHIRGFNVAKSLWGGGAVTDKDGWVDTGLQASASGKDLFSIIQH